MKRVSYKKIIVSILSFYTSIRRNQVPKPTKSASLNYMLLNFNG